MKGDKKQMRDVQIDKMEAGLAGGPEKSQSRQLSSASRKLPLRFSSLLPDSLVRGAWGIGGCTSHLPCSAPGGGRHGAGETRAALPTSPPGQGLAGAGCMI